MYLQKKTKKKKKKKQPREKHDPKHLNSLPEGLSGEDDDSLRSSLSYLNSLTGSLRRITARIVHRCKKKERLRKVTFPLFCIEVPEDSEGGSQFFYTLQTS